MAYTDKSNFTAYKQKVTYQDFNELAANDDYLKTLFNDVNKIFSGTFSRNMASAGGNVSYSGVGFQPSGLIVIGGLNAHGISLGSCKNTSDRCVWMRSDGTTNYQNGYLIYSFEDSAADYQRALLLSFDSDGFTLTWSTAGTPTGTAYYRYLAFL